MYPITFNNNETPLNTFKLLFSIHHCYLFPDVAPFHFIPTFKRWSGRVGNSFNFRKELSNVEVAISPSIRLWEKLGCSRPNCFFFFNIFFLNSFFLMLVRTVVGCQIYRLGARVLARAHSWGLHMDTTWTPKYMTKPSLEVSTRPVHELGTRVLAMAYG